MKDVELNFFDDVARGVDEEVARFRNLGDPRIQFKPQIFLGLVINFNSIDPVENF